MKKRSMRLQRPVKTESWQIIYMDLMTNIMVFFVILWSLNQGKSEGISDTVGDTTTRLIDLPGDILFAPGKTEITQEGKSIIKNLFYTSTGSILNFDTSGLVKRMLVIHGHTDSDGKKEENIQLGFDRAYSAYREVLSYSHELPNHVIICSHADNTPEQEVPKFEGAVNAVQRETLREAKSKNRRITLEDKLINRFQR